MLSCQNDTTTDVVRAEIVDAILSLAAQGATVAELIEGLEWGRAVSLVPEADEWIGELINELRTGRLIMVRS
jgi:hypothetical protein